MPDLAGDRARLRGRFRGPILPDYRKLQTWMPTATREAIRASKPSSKPAPPSRCTGGAVVRAELVEADVDVPGFLCTWTEAWGKPERVPTLLGGTFAVSFLLSAEAGAKGVTSETEGGFAVAGATDADGIVAEGGLELTGGGEAKDGGLGAPGGAPMTDGGFGARGAPPAKEGGGFGAGGGADNPEGEGNFGGPDAIGGGLGP
jgi:hypothetical protein